MDLKALSFQIRSGSIAMRVLLRAFILATALSVVALVQILSGYDPVIFNPVNSIQCDAPLMFKGSGLINSRILKPIWGGFECKEDVNVTLDLVRELIRMEMIDYSSKALCVGKGAATAVHALQELGFVNTCGVNMHSPFFSFKHRKFVYELAYADNSFDFVLAGDLDRISVPAILVLEIESVLKPGGIGAMLVDSSDTNSNGLIRSATPISSLLKTSTVVHVGYVHETTLVVFRKKTYTTAYFEQFPLPSDCQSVVNNGPFVEYLEPLTENKQTGFEKNIAYLAKFVDVASRKRLAYVDIGTGENLNSGNPSWFLPSYPINHTAFNVYLVDHNTSVLLSYVKKPRVTFIYYPELVGDEVASNPDVNDWTPYADDKGFDFHSWFKETVQYADFVVLKMKAGEVELKFLTELFESGTICLVDELFLTCSDREEEKGVPKGECMDLFQSLRSSGVYMHQWWGN